MFQQTVVVRCQGATALVQPMSRSSLTVSPSLVVCLWAATVASMITEQICRHCSKTTRLFRCRHCNGYGAVSGSYCRECKGQGEVCQHCEKPN